MAARTADPDELFALALGGDRAALARVLSLVEQGGEAARAVGRLAFPLAGGAAVVGLTGAPGAGKSTLASAVVGAVRARGGRVGVLAVDPSSPFSGGAILGDRVRMGAHDLDPGVLVRSLATRGQLGGLAPAVPGAARVLDAAGFPLVVVETVGVGQVELDVAGAADATVVVVNPGWGDAVQAAKAGLLEVADVLVVNKADRPGADQARADLEGVLGLSPGARGWRPPVVPTVATTGEGVDDLLAALDAHRRWAEGSGELARRRRARSAGEVHGLVAEAVLAEARRLGSGATFDQLCQAVAEGRLDPWSAADELLAGRGR